MKKERYNRYSSYLVKQFGEKVYKLPVNLPVSCPNRTAGGGGCTYCGGLGAGFENLSSVLSVREQLERNKGYIGKRYKAKKFIAYFQNFTNTYLPVETFARYMEEASAVPEVAAVSVSTRPDCIHPAYLDVLKRIAEEKGLAVTIELGLQSANYHSLLQVNRGHTLAEYLDAVLAIKGYGFSIGTHMILNLPWDTMADVEEGAKILSALRIDFVKLHALYIETGTKLADAYERREFSICSVEEYEERAVRFLELLSPDIVIERLIGRAPEEGTLFSNWGMSWWKIHDEIVKKMEERDSYQGKGFAYLGGAAVKKFV